jgi:GAF domain-containing protein
MSDQPSLADALATIERQAREIERLRQRAHDERFVEDLREALIESAAAGVIASPVTQPRLLELIVETAAQVIAADAASLFLVDRQTEELIFAVALGGKAEEVKNLRVPLGHGIAGLVAVSGQPMAISDAESDPRHASDIAQTVDYQPKSILCVPLLYDEQVIGVLELLDKQGAASFSPEDMEVLWLFGAQAAVAIEQSRATRDLAALVEQSLSAVVTPPGKELELLQQRAGAFTTRLTGEESFLQAVTLAEVVAEIARHGSAETQTCHDILQNFASYLRSRAKGNLDLGFDL